MKSTLEGFIYRYGSGFYVVSFPTYTKLLRQAPAQRLIDLWILELSKLETH